MRKTDFKYLGYCDDYDEYIFDVKGKSLKEINSLCGYNVIAIGYDPDVKLSYIYGVENTKQIMALSRFMEKILNTREFDDNKKVKLIDVILKKEKLNCVF